MATRKRIQNQTVFRKFIEEHRSTLSSALLALIILVIGFFAYNGLYSQTNSNKKTETKQTQNQTSKIPTSNTTQNSQNTNATKKNPSTNSQVKVEKGDNLWNIAVKYYNDGFKWTEIAKANNISNPNKISQGSILTLPNINENAAPTTQPNIPQKMAKTSTYTVVKGDSLWKIAIKFYGSGYSWYKIRDANAGKIGLLPNGRPLITPGTVLTIPSS